MTVEWVEMWVEMAEDWSEWQWAERNDWEWARRWSSLPFRPLCLSSRLSVLVIPTNGRGLHYRGLRSLPLVGMTENGWSR